MRRAFALALSIAVATGVACSRQDLDEAEPEVLAARPPVPVPAEVERWLPVAPRWWATWGQRTPFVVNWSSRYTTSFVRCLDGWEELDGVPHARVAYRLLWGKKLETPVVEWLRPETGADGALSLVVPRRRVAGRQHRLDPPLPWLRFPLEDGRSWSWSGTVDGQPASDVARVKSPATWRGRGGLVAVEHVSEVGKLRCTRTAYLLDGFGMVGEEASFADEPGNAQQVWIPR